MKARLGMSSENRAQSNAESLLGMKCLYDPVRSAIGGRSRNAERSLIQIIAYMESGLH
jgi:hypothetical protein